MSHPVQLMNMNEPHFPVGFIPPLNEIMDCTERVCHLASVNMWQDELRGARLVKSKKWNKKRIRNRV